MPIFLLLSMFFWSLAAWADGYCDRGLLGWSANNGSGVRNMSKPWYCDVIDVGLYCAAFCVVGITTEAVGL